MATIEKTKIIYLRCDPNKCYERTKIRKRAEEDEIPLEYLQMIHTKHENWFKEYDSSKVLIIDTTEDFKDDEVRVSEMLEQIKAFIGKEWFQYSVSQF